MISFGAPVLAEDREAIINYLVQDYPPLRRVKKTTK